MGKAPLRLLGSFLVEVQFVLTVEPSVTVILFADVTTDRFLIQSDRPHTVAHRPGMQTRHPTLLHQFPMDADGTLPFQEGYVRF